MEERLQKLLSEAGVCSRRKAEEYITAGRVEVNGTAAKLGDKADLARDIITLDGQRIKPSEERIWLMLHKPRGYVTTLSDEKGRQTAWELVKDCGCRVWPVGRLDLDSEGLLLFTNDGEGTNRLLHPSHEVEKEYIVTVKGNVEAALPILRGKLELDGELLAPAKVECLKRYTEGGELSVSIRQGKNRQVRRMCALAGLEVKRLKRIREGALLLGDLPVGKWRRLSQGEVERLFK
ncbi:MAG: rRNA pseudouridine synthase [Oscillospiraceae bacterium]|nr:rRNA pseudouridine synthase [Oscillospiraceae bacterium]